MNEKYIDDNILDSYSYEIPKKLIAQKPIKNRQDSRLFIVNKKTKKFYHKKFSDIIEYFNAGDCIVINTTKVIPSRLFGKKNSGGKVELLFLNPCQKNEKYKVLIKPSIGIGKKIYFENNYECEVISKTEFGESTVKFNKLKVLEFLEKHGIMPLPPYIKRKNGLAHKLSDFDKQRYQTIYAKNLGAIAAPTAGLHFTENIIKDLKKKNVNIATLTLHVGWGTFKPITTLKLDNHNMLPEKFFIDKTNAKIINLAINNNKRIISVGTTSARALESAVNERFLLKNGKVFIKEYSGETSIFIHPGYKFRIINALITNFHLPKSTPLMMVSAFSSRETILKAYKEAIKKKYRFFSYGDSMLIL
ncbi:MAG: tRNA preQ1(34) S-adenosylmethionine ribosyltransferase-isomerase QueA [Endomicrobium sp.]|jgi:S-adenosylmethionine:tRNA ribosyltransferase-isomerase|nr:tRNA preQ1(34) S-adenosylmethionine ribosyltransferase-isomerase QueA [Endomicrobium sp.]